MPSELIYTDNLDDFAVELNRVASEAVDKAADAALLAVHATPTHGYKIQDIVGKVFRTGVERTSKGAGVWIIGQDWRTIFFELGTYTRRRKRPSDATIRRRSSSSGQARVANWNGNPGVYAIYFITRGARVGRKLLPKLIEEGARNIRIG